MLLGIGIGMIIATSFMVNAKIHVNLSKYQIEMKAREYGMEYKDEQKVIETPSSDNAKEGVAK